MTLIKVINKFRLILSKHQKLRVIELSVLMVIGGILESLSVSLVLPFMDAAMNADSVMEKPYAVIVCELLHIHSSRGFLVVLAIALAVIYLLKNIYLLFEYNIQYGFVYRNMFEMQKRLLDNFIHRPYEYFLKVNSGEIVRILNVDTTTTFNMLSTILGLFSETVISIMLISTVFIMSPLITAIMAALMLFLLCLISSIIKPVLKQAGIDNQAAGAGMNKWLLQSIQGIKELKVMNREEFFQKNYDKYGQQYIRSLRKNQILGITPRFVIEAVSMSAMFVILSVLIYRGGDLEQLIPVISAAAMAAVRLLPSVNRISAGLGTVSYGEPMLDKLIENLKDISGKDEISLMMNLEYEDEYQEHRDAIAFNKNIYFHDITYQYPGADHHVIEGADMVIKAGESAGIIGESGAGKTTAVDIMLGLLRPKSGQVLVDGMDIRSNMSNWLQKIGYIPQMIFMLDDTIRANISFGMPEDQFEDQDVWDALRDASLDEFVKSLPDGLDTEIGERGVRISGGQRQRIGIARALFRQPEVLVFDEATSALDNTTEAAIMESVEQLHGKKTLIIIAHRMTTIESCDHVFRVENEKIEKVR